MMMKLKKRSFSTGTLNFYGLVGKEETNNTVNVLKFLTLFSIVAWIHKMLFRITNREDPDQTASSEAV